MQPNSHTYKAFLDGNTLKWVGEHPVTRKGEPIQVDIVVNEVKNTQKGNGAEIAAILDRIAASGEVTEDWLNEWEASRKDRLLPGREE